MTGKFVTIESISQEPIQLQLSKRAINFLKLCYDILDIFFLKMSLRMSEIIIS